MRVRNRRHRHFGPFGYPDLLHYGVTAFLFVVSVAVSLAVTDLGTIFSYLGGTLGVVVPFVLPACMLLCERQGAVEVHSRMLESP